MEMKEIATALAAHNATVERMQEKLNEIGERTRDLEQKGDGRRLGALGGSGDNAIATLAQCIVQSEGLVQFKKGLTQAAVIEIPSALMKTAIVNATGQNQPLVPAERREGIATGPQRRFTIRQLFANVPTSSNMIEFCRENVYTNNAGPQYDSTSPTPGQEGSTKNESGITFELATAAVTTLAHWIPASRQVLSDAPMLERFLNDRLLYGLKLEEEDELLNGSGASGQLSGLITNATVFTGGATNQNAIDTLAKAANQLVEADYEPSGFVLHPRDWLNILLLKDSQGRYLFGDPALAQAPRIWGLPVVATPTMVQGQFLCLDAPRAGYIADREEASIRISEHHQDFFVRNMVAVLCEERLTLVIEKASAIIYGALSYAG